MTSFQVPRCLQHFSLMGGFWAFACLAHAAPGDVVFEAETEQANYRVVSVAEGLDIGWDMEFLPDGRLLVSEYDGRLRLINVASGQQQVMAAIKDTTERGGLRGISAHPQFASNGLLYFCYATGSHENNHTRIARARFDGQSVAAPEVIFDADNKANELAHYGCRLNWLPDGSLLASFGDRRHHAAASQSLDNHYGVAVRLSDAGQPAAGNPFAASSGVRQDIWAYGLRNAQGGVFHPQTGELWATEHGPRGGDEINVLKPGRNYGWPVATFGIDYDGTVLTETALRDDVEPPRFYWYPSVAPSSLAFYTGTEFGKWQNDLFVTTLARQRLLRLELLDGHVIRTEELFGELDRRLRDVTMGPDGRLYVLTDAGDGRVLRIEPK